MESSSQVSPPVVANAATGGETPNASIGANQPLLSLRNISKHFGAVHALSGVNLDIPTAKVTALIGDNGAGKSTLIKTIAGIWGPSEGDIFWNGEHVTIKTPREADELGVATVYQDLALCDNLDVVANMFLGHESLRHRLLDENKMEADAKKTLAGLSVTTVKSVHQLVESLSGGQRQSVAVARAVMRDAKLVIMDEPTAALGVSQTAQVLGLIRRLADRGITVLVISHNLNDVFSIADRLAVMHLGRMVHSGPIADYTPQSAVEIITTGKFVGDTSNSRTSQFEKAQETTHDQ
jgi:ABC-type sugar transport system ATPase subunit